MAFPGLASGDYMLAETRTHPNFELPRGQWMVRLDVPADSFDIRARGDMPPAFKTEGEGDAATLVLPNYRLYALPLAGSSGAALINAAAAAALVLSVLIAWQAFRRRRPAREPGRPQGRR